MKYLLDTNVVSEATRPRPEPRVLAWLDALPVHHGAVSAMTVGEMERGILQLGETARAVSLRTRVNRVMGPDLAVLPLDRAVLVHWARLVVMAERAGRPPSVADALLAATCVQHGLTLATRDTRDFEVFGIPLVNPWTA